MTLYRAPKPRAPLASTGRRQRRRSAFYAASKSDVVRRVIASGGRCESCGQRDRDLDPHHVFGRAGTGARIGWPWCDMPEMIAAVCRECHDVVTVTPDGTKDRDLKIRALRRFAERGVREGWLAIETAELIWHDDLNAAARMMADAATANAAEEQVGAA